MFSGEFILSTVWIGILKREIFPDVHGNQKRGEKLGPVCSASRKIPSDGDVLVTLSSGIHPLRSTDYRPL